MTDKKQTKKIDIDSISLSIGNKKIRLTFEECKRLYDKLTEMFGIQTQNYISSPSIHQSTLGWAINESENPLPAITCHTNSLTESMAS